MACLPNNLGPQSSHEGCRILHGNGVLEANFNSDATHLAAVRTAIESLCTEGGFDAKATGEIGLVVNEAIANVIRHAYGSVSNMPIHLKAQLKGNGPATEIEVTIRDWGNGKSPTASGKPTPPDPLTPGGLGLICMHKMMDQVLFTPQARGMLLTMRRKRTA
jgi:anti-sigma regulatory factor (Ser/Thr protein kinase)